MGIGYFQLTIKNPQDKYLIGNPEFTYFKSTYKRHTNFAIENMIINFTGETFLDINSNFNKKFYTIIPKNGDLIHRMYIMIKLEDITQDIEGINGITKPIDSDDSQSEDNIKKQSCVSIFGLIDYIEISIGDQLIDKHTGEWLHWYYQLFLNNSKNHIIGEMLNSHINTKGNIKGINKHKDGIIYIPLAFWFNRNIGLSLPLIALQYSDIKINLKLNKRTTFKNENVKNLKMRNTLKINNIRLLVEYIHLDKQEKLLFSSNSHEYLIEQVQNNLRNTILLKKGMLDKSYEDYNHKIELAFNNPIKEIFWAIQDDQSLCNIKGDSYLDDNGDIKIRENKGNHLFNYWRNLDWKNRGHQFIEATLNLNGNDIFDYQNANYFNSVMKYQFHSGYGFNNMKDIASIDLNNHYRNIDYKKGSGIYCYSFALNPENYQPSGTLNFSKLDKAELRLKIRRDLYNNSNINGKYKGILNQKFIKIYAINYNILNIFSGQCGLLFK